MANLGLQVEEVVVTPNGPHAGPKQLVGGDHLAPAMHDSSPASVADEASAGPGSGGGGGDADADGGSGGGRGTAELRCGADESCMRRTRA